MSDQIPDNNKPHKAVPSKAHVVKAPQKPVLKKSSMGTTASTFRLDGTAYTPVMSKSMIPLRMSRSEFRAGAAATLIGMLTYPFVHPLKFIYRFRCPLLIIAGLACMYLGYEIAAGIIAIIWILDTIISFFTGLASISFTGLGDAKYLPICRRIHDFGWSAFRSLLLPWILWGASMIGVAIWEISSLPEEEEDFRRPQVISWYESRQERLEREKLEKEREEKRALTKEIEGCAKKWEWIFTCVFLGWGVVLVPAMCFMRKGTPGPNKYGAQPNE